MPLSNPHWLNGPRTRYCGTRRVPWLKPRSACTTRAAESTISDQSDGIATLVIKSPQLGNKPLTLDDDMVPIIYVQTDKLLRVDGCGTFPWSPIRPIHAVIPCVSQFISVQRFMLESAFATRITEGAVVVIGSRGEDHDVVGGTLPQKVICCASAIARGALRVFQRQLDNTIGYTLQCAAPYPRRRLTSLPFRSCIALSLVRLETRLREDRED